MKNILATCFLLICINVFGSETTTNYVGKLIINVDGKETQYDQKTVIATVDGNSVTLKINAFAIGNYSGLNIDLGCTKQESTLTDPITLTVTPKLISVLLGTLVPTLNGGTLTDSACSLDLSIVASKTGENIHVTFNGTK